MHTFNTYNYEKNLLGFKHFIYAIYGKDHCSHQVTVTQEEKNFLQQVAKLAELPTGGNFPLYDTFILAKNKSI